MTDLPFLRDAGAVVARRGDQGISPGEFLADIQRVAEQLPDHRYVVNFCADRYRFTVAWAAAMLRAQITLLPSGGDPASATALRADYPDLYVLSDDEVACQTLPGTATSSRVPAFPPDLIAAVLFTSGSTGRPIPSVRRWGRLVRASLAAGAALGIGRHRGAAVVATVPHAHSYGLESAVMLPLQHGLLLTADRPFFPADVAAALGGEDQPGILITAPVHLNALVGDAETAAPSRPAGLLLSATAPLSPELAARAETAFGARVFEIYGCSEAGQLAARRTTEDPVWRCLEGFHLRQDGAGTWACGPDEGDVLLADEIALTDDGFILHGRAADMVNIAGKRSSLAHLTRQLLAIDGVADGVYLMPESPAPGASPRLTAVAVAPGLDAATVLAALRGRIDPAFLPRPLHIVDALPRNTLGKLPRHELLRLLADTAPIRLCFPLDHPAAAGHFPGNPIIPGAVLLDHLVPALLPDGCPGEIAAAKFHHPVRPGDTVTVRHRTERGLTRFECRLADSDRLVLSGALRPTFPSR